MTNRNGEVGGGGGSGPIVAENDDWESMLESGQLDKSLEKITIKPQPLPLGAQNVASTAGAGTFPGPPPTDQNGSKGGGKQVMLATRSGPARPLMSDPFLDVGCPVRILTHDGNAARTQYRPPEPQLKILKRPALADSSGGGSAGKSNESQQGGPVRYRIPLSDHRYGTPTCRYLP